VLKGRRLSVPERGVRPTSDRTREAIFDILGPPAVAGACVLDLYAGTGALGIEALSRGAERADFVEGGPDVARRIEENLRRFGLEARGTVHRADLSGAALPSGLPGPWRLVFLDPPYEGDEGARWVDAIAAAGVLDPGGVLVYERRNGAPAPQPPALILTSDRAYGETAVAFYRTAGPVGRP